VLSAVAHHTLSDARAGATGNIDTESVVYALHESGYSTGFDLAALARIGGWISEEIGRPNGSSAGRALLAREAKAQRDAQKETRARL
jgi:hydroxymethylglutaryl-CoA lyase